MEAALDELASRGFGERERNRLLPPREERARAEALRQVGAGDPMLGALYEACDGAALADVNNGLYLPSVDRLLRGLTRDLRMIRVGQGFVRALPIASDGGGALFALLGDRSGVCVVRDREIKDGICDFAAGTLEIVARDLRTFLERVLWDVEAYAAGDHEIGFLSNSRRLPRNLVEPDQRWAGVVLIGESRMGIRGAFQALTHSTDRCGRLVMSGDCMEFAVLEGGRGLRIWVAKVEIRPYHTRASLEVFVDRADVVAFFGGSGAAEYRAEVEGLAGSRLVALGPTGAPGDTAERVAHTVAERLPRAPALAAARPITTAVRVPFLPSAFLSVYEGNVWGWNVGGGALRPDLPTSRL